LIRDWTLPPIVLDSSASWRIVAGEKDLDTDAADRMAWLQPRRGATADLLRWLVSGQTILDHP